MLCKGTGTKVGDPIECRAIYETLGKRASPNRKLILGSVKPNIGHLEGAASMAGLIKGVLALEKGVIPPNLYFNKPNPAIPFDKWNLHVPTKMTPWPRGETRRMSVSSFGVGGTNAHAIVENAKDLRKRATVFANNNSITGLLGSSLAPAKPPQKQLFVISSYDQGGVARVAQTLVSHLDTIQATAPPDYVADLAYTLGVKRSKLNWKYYCAASSLSQLRNQLASLQGNAAVRSNKTPSLGFIFTGQGAQWARMGIELLERPVFKTSMDECDMYLASLGCSWRAIDELGHMSGKSRIDEPEVSQTLCTILQIALVDLLRSYGVTPSRVVGHSSGEIAAAYCIGALSKFDAVSVAYLRGVASASMKKVAPQFDGGMMAVGASQHDVDELIALMDNADLTVACVNSPSNVTVSGSVQRLKQLQATLDEKGIFAKRLAIDVAYHSDHIQEIYPSYVQAMGHIHGIPAHEAGGPVMFSSVEGGQAVPELLGAFYWGRNLINPVYFSDALAEMVTTPVEGQPPSPSTNAVDLLVEIGPHSALSGPVGEVLEKSNVKGIEYQSALIRGVSAIDSVLDLAGWLFARGYPVDIGKVNGGESLRTITDLPPYPWNHSRRFDAGSRINREFSMRSQPQRSLLGTAFTSISERERIWRSHLRLEEEGWIRDHKVVSVVLFPGAGLVVMAIEAAQQMADAGKTIRALKLRDISFGTAVVVNEDKATEVIIHLRPHLTSTAGSSSDSTWLEFTVSTSGSADMPIRENCHGLIQIDYKATEDQHMAHELSSFLDDQISNYKAANEICAQELDVEDFYRDLGNVGLEFGPTFRNIKKLRLGDGKTVFELTIGDPGEIFSTGHPGRHHLIHPTTLDSIFSPSFSAVYDGRTPPNRPLIPTFIEELTIACDIPDAVGTRMKGVATAKMRGSGEVSADINVFDESGSSAYITLRGFRCTTEISNESQPQGQSNATHSLLCSYPSWEYAYSLLEPSELQRVVEDSGPTSDARVAKICEMLLYEQPESRVLELLPAAEDTELSIQSSITSTAKLSQPGLVKHALFGSKTAPSNKEVLCIGVPSDSKNSADTTKQYDLIIVPERCKGIPGLHGSYRQLKALLSPTGQLICGTNLGTPRVTDGLTRTLSMAKPSGFVEVYSATHINGILPERAEVIILEPPNPSNRVAAFTVELTAALRSHGVEVRIDGWGSQILQDAAGKHIVSLLELENSYLENLSASNFDLIRSITLTSSSLIWITGFSEPTASIAAGLLRSIRRESVGQRLQLLHLDPKILDDRTGAHITARIFCCHTKETEFFVEQDGMVKLNRIRQETIINTKIASLMSKETHIQPLGEVEYPVKLAIEKPGLLDTLYFEKHTGLAGSLEDDMVEIRVEASGMNFRDIMISMGIIASTELGYEASGTVTAVGREVKSVKVGDRVCAHVVGAHATFARTKDFMCAAIPDSISFEAGAAMPVVFTTAYHALVNIARLRRGQSILIHAAAGGVGQAAVQLAQHLGLTIYATVGSTEKRNLVKTRYGIPDEHIFYSRDASFSMGVKRVTNGRGVDCVLNSLAGELLRNSFYCLAPLGIMVDIGSRDALDNMRLDMRPFSRSATFVSFNLLDLVEQAPEVMAQATRDTFELVRQGVLQSPHPLTVLRVNQIQDAFRMMQSGKHLGKLVISFQGNPGITVLRDSQDFLTLSPDYTYLLVGGLGGLGRSLARMLVGSGARNLAFVSRSGASSTDSCAVVDELVQLGASVKAYQADISDMNALNQVLDRCSGELPPIKGVFQLAMLLRDSLYETMTHPQWVEATRPKIQGTWNLHQYFDHTHKLDFFINLSSISGIIGNKGQANYSAGAAFQDAISHHRRRQGLKCVSLDLGIMLDVGVIAENGSKGDLKRWEEVIGVREPLFHALMKAVISDQEQSNLASSLTTQICVGLGTAEAFDAAGVPRPDYLTDDARFSPLLAVGSSTGSASATQGGAPASLKAQLAVVTSMKQAVDLITGALVNKAADILQTPSVEIDPSRPIYLYGVDSLVAMEVRNWIRREIDAQVAIFDILEAVPITQLAQKIAKRANSISIPA
ncbi:Type I Iterative PKS [Exserohilum turcicum]